MRALASACIIFAICIAASLQDTPHARCDDGPQPKSLRVDGCDGSPCNFYRGTNLTAQWNFEANADAQTLTTRVRVTVMGVKINYPYPYPNACESLTNSKCPLRKGDEATYNLFMPISKFYPKVTMTIEFALVDENNNVQVCYKVDGKVVDK